MYGLFKRLMSSYSAIIVAKMRSVTFNRLRTFKPTEALDGCGPCLFHNPTSQDCKCLWIFELASLAPNTIATLPTCLNINLLRWITGRSSSLHKRVISFLRYMSNRPCPESTWFCNKSSLILLGAGYWYKNNLVRGERKIPSVELNIS